MGNVSLGVPISGQLSGMFNTYIVPVELSWKLWNSGFVFKTGLGIYWMMELKPVHWRLVTSPIRTWCSSPK